MYPATRQMRNISDTINCPRSSIDSPGVTKVQDSRDLVSKQKNNKYGDPRGSKGFSTQETKNMVNGKITDGQQMEKDQFASLQELFKTELREIYDRRKGIFEKEIRSALDDLNEMLKTQECVIEDLLEIPIEQMIQLSEDDLKSELIYQITKQDTKVDSEMSLSTKPLNQKAQTTTIRRPPLEIAKLKKRSISKPSERKSTARTSSTKQSTPVPTKGLKKPPTNSSKDLTINLCNFEIRLTNEYRP